MEISSPEKGMSGRHGMSWRKQEKAFDYNRWKNKKVDNGISVSG